MTVSADVRLTAPSGRAPEIALAGRPRAATPARRRLAGGSSTSDKRSRRANLPMLCSAIAALGRDRPRARICRHRRSCRSPPLWGRWPAGQRGVLTTADPPRHLPPRRRPHRPRHRPALRPRRRRRPHGLRPAGRIARRRRHPPRARSAPFWRSAPPTKPPRRCSTRPGPSASSSTPTDPRTAISACPGAPACASGHIAARELAAAVAPDLADLLDAALHLHISGCAKGCAHPGKAALTLVGSEIGAGIVVDGTARDRPLAYTARRGCSRRPGTAGAGTAGGRIALPGYATQDKLAEAFGKE